MCDCGESSHASCVISPRFSRYPIEAWSTLAEIRVPPLTTPPPRPSQANNQENQVSYSLTLWTHDCNSSTAKTTKRRRAVPYELRWERFIEIGTDVFQRSPTNIVIKIK